MNDVCVCVHACTHTQACVFLSPFFFTHGFLLTVSKVASTSPGLGLACVSSGYGFGFPSMKLVIISMVLFPICFHFYVYLVA